MKTTALLFLGLGICLMTGCKKPEPPEIEILEPYAVRARVLRMESYNNYWAPRDAALAWEELLPIEETKNVIILQGDRRFWWFAPAGSGLNEKMARMSANTHLIATDEKSRQLALSLEVNETYYLEGYLVAAKFEDGLNIRSSLSRADTGDGACEVFLLSSVEKVSP